MQEFLAWIYANPTLAAAIAVAIFAFMTGKITIAGLIAAITDAFKPKIPPVVVVDPANPAPPSPNNWLTMIQMILALITKARAEGDKAAEEAALKLLDNIPKPR